MESQPQNPEFRENSESFHPWNYAEKLCFSGPILDVKIYQHQNSPGRVTHSVTCLATDASLTADPGVASSIPAQSNTYVEIDHKIISTVILLPSLESFKEGCCQLQA